MSKEAAAAVIGTCFHTRTNAHILHLKSRSYAQHTALGCFYEELIPLVDCFAETYMGKHGMIETYATRFVAQADPLKMIADFITKIEGEYNAFSPTCRAVLDDILALAYSTQYKLKTLK